MVVGTWIAASQEYTPVWDTPVVGATVYTGLVALTVNLAVAVVLTLVQDDELEETREPAPAVSAGVA